MWPLSKKNLFSFILCCVLLSCTILGIPVLSTFASKNKSQLVDTQALALVTSNADKQNNGFMCTGIRLIAQNDAVVYGRTMEFGKNTDSEILVIPRNYAFVGSTPFKEMPGLKWHSKYAVVGANVAGATQLVDGVNEAGLAGGLFYFSECAEFQDISPADAATSIAPSELMTWILTTCANVAEVKKSLPKIRVTKSMFKPWGFIPPVHAVVHDAQGNSLVIEYVKGILHLYDNPLGIITNSPTFDWHLTNLKNYGALFSDSFKKLKKCVAVEPPLPKGSGSLGLPGDFSSTSRFIRAAFFSQTIIPPIDENETRDVLFHLLNLFDIPIGIERSCQELYDYTQWTSVSDLRNKKYYFHTYENRQIYCVDLMKCNLDAVKPTLISMKRPNTIIDCTPQNTKGTARSLSQYRS